jgi:hypothetical protein
MHPKAISYKQQPPNPPHPFCLYLDYRHSTTLYYYSLARLLNYACMFKFNVVGVRLLRIVIVSRSEDAKETQAGKSWVSWSALHATRTRMLVALHSLTS